MAKKGFRGPEIVRKFEEAIDEGFASFLVNTQSKLSASSPVDTGRLASSWVIGKGRPDRASPGERQRGSRRVSIDRYSGKITAQGDWYISSNLPYAERAAFDPGYTGRLGGTNGQWFTSIENRLPEDARRSINSALSKVK